MSATGPGRGHEHLKMISPCPRCGMDDLRYGCSKRHDLKCWPGPFEATVVKKWKMYEIRQNDRDFRAWDKLVLKEWDPKTNDYTGREAAFIVTYLTQGGDWGLPRDLCVMGISQI